MKIRFYLRGGGAFEIPATSFKVSIHQSTQRIMGYEWDLAPEKEADKLLLYCAVEEIAAIVSVHDNEDDGKVVVAEVSPVKDAAKEQTAA